MHYYMAYWNLHNTGTVLLAAVVVHMNMHSAAAYLDFHNTVVLVVVPAGKHMNMHSAVAYPVRHHNTNKMQNYLEVRFRNTYKSLYFPP
jgi:hypothetical protein